MTTSKRNLASYAGDFNSWLSTNNDGPWSMTRPTDAQKESLVWVGISILIALSFWKGIPYGYPHWNEIYAKDECGDYEYTDLNKTIRKTRLKLFFKWIPILAPIKYLTVLYHEMCHAIVGTLSGGRPILILVSWNEGGETIFRPWGDQPNHLLTLPAGYIGSCIIGCAFLFAGFDTVASKYAFVIFEVMAVISLLMCLWILPKSALRHNPHWLQCGTKRVEGKEENGQDKKDDKACATDREKMVSFEVIVLTNIVVGGLVALAWLLYDSLYLRFIFIFLGTINALYAIWDIYLDGVKHSKVSDDVKYSKVEKSDCTEMAKEFKDKRAQKGKTAHTVKYYARIWFTIELVLFAATIVLALYTWRDTIAQQALRSRETFLPTPNHYNPADLLD